LYLLDRLSCPEAALPQMGKSIRSKVKKQFRTIKRESLDEKERVRLEKIVTKLEDAAAPGTGLPVLPRRQQIIVMETDDEPANSKRNKAHIAAASTSHGVALCACREQAVDFAGRGRVGAPSTSSAMAVDTATKVKKTIAKKDKPRRPTNQERSRSKGRPRPKF